MIFLFRISTLNILGYSIPLGDCAVWRSDLFGRSEVVCAVLSAPTPTSAVEILGTFSLVEKDANFSRFGVQRMVVMIVARAKSLGFFGPTRRVWADSPWMKTKKRYLDTHTHTHTHTHTPCNALPRFWPSNLECQKNQIWIRSKFDVPTKFYLDGLLG
jgi:hypothetical protein